MSAARAPRPGLRWWPWPWCRLLPLGPAQEYIWHVIIQIFIWSFMGSAWSLMGRFGLVSLGHGAFLGVGAYATVLLWNFFGLTPWIGAHARRGR